MKTIKVSYHATPKAIYGKIFKAIPNIGDKVKFSNSVEESVNLNAKNTKNLNSQDLARLQVMELGERYGVSVEET